MRCTLHLDVSIFKPIPYKYFVYSPRAKDHESRWEVLRGTKSNDMINRYLEVPTESRKPKGETYDI